MNNTYYCNLYCQKRVGILPIIMIGVMDEKGLLPVASYLHDGALFLKVTV